MIDTLFDRANEYLDEDDFEHAIPLFIESLNKGNIESAYTLGTLYLDCYEDLGLEKPDYDKAMSYLEIGASHNDKDCQKALGELLAEVGKSCTDILRAIYLLLLSEDYKENEIISLIRKIYKDINFLNSLNTERIICQMDEFIKITNDKNLKNKFKECRNRLIILYAQNIIEDSKSYEILKDRFSFFSPYLNEYFFIDTNRVYSKKEVDLFLSLDPNYLEVIKYQEEMENKYKRFDRKTRDYIYFYLADSYWKGNHGANKDIDLALDYYKKINTPIMLFEFEKYFEDYCQQKIQSEEFDLVKKILPYVKDVRVQKEIKNKLYVKELKKKANDGDIDAKIKLAGIYEKGDIVEKNLEKAITIHQELYQKYRMKESFDFLFYNYYRKLRNIEKIKRFINDAKEHDVPFNEEEENMFENLNGEYYATNEYEFKCTRGLNEIDREGNIIYYLYNYYKKWWMENYPKESLYKSNFLAFMAIKNRNYSSENNSLNFPAALCNFLKFFKEEEWVVCTVPGHKKTDNAANGVFDVLCHTYKGKNIIVRNTIIQRIVDIEKKATDPQRSFDYRRDMHSIAIEPGYDVTGKNIIVIDDITTTGCSLIACRNLLLSAGAKRVVLLALGKTKEQDFYG